VPQKLLDGVHIALGGVQLPVVRQQGEYAILSLGFRERLHVQLPRQRETRARLLQVLGLLARSAPCRLAERLFLLFLDLKGRVSKRLLLLAGVGPDAPRPAPDAVPTTRDISQADLAALCGGSRENVNRVLSELQRRGMVERRGRRYALTDVPALRRLAGT
jgi:CRP-like cAMP-binding protein